MGKLWGCKIFNGTKGGVIDFGAVEFEGDKIKKVEALPKDSVIPAGADIIDAAGMTALPGFFDCETHLVMDGNHGCVARMTAGSSALAMFNAVKNAESFLLKGVTTIRDLGDKSYETLLLRDMIKAGKSKGPTIYASGMPIRCTGGHFTGHMVDGVDEARKAVREVIHKGVDVVKVISSSSTLTRGQYEVGVLELMEDEMRAIAEYAHACCRPVASHAHSEAAIRNSLLAGADTIEHGTSMTAPNIELMLKKGAWLIPTFTPYVRMSRDTTGSTPDNFKRFTGRVMETKSEYFIKAFKAGVKIAMGTDAGAPMTPHGYVAGELGFMMEAGLTAEQALLAATSAAAALLGIEKEVGVLKEGYTADIAVVKGDPLQDIKTLDNVAMVFQNGRLVVKDGRLM